MEESKCHHLRIRDTNEYGLNVEQFINSIERHFKFDLKNLPQWKEIVQRLYMSTTNYKRIVQDANLRKKIIINKLYTQTTRLSPFQLTYVMARTRKKWKAMEARQKNLQMSPETSEEMPTAVEYDVILGELDVLNDTAHPNTEIIPSVGTLDPPIKIDVETEVNIGDISHLPIYITLNQHKLISPIATSHSGFSYKSQNDEYEIKTETEFKEWKSLKQTSFIKYFPGEIVITENIEKEQCIKFSVINCTTEYLHLRYKCVTDRTYFKKTNILPVTPIKLYPGIAVTLKFIFTIFQNEENKDFASSLYFRVGRNVYSESPAESCVIPIVSKFTELSSVSVTEKVYFPPRYSWHINGKCGYPTGIVKITVHDKRHYHLHVLKRFVNFCSNSESSYSIDAIGPNTESLVERIDVDKVVSEQSKLLSSSRMADTPPEIEVDESIKTIDYIALIVGDIIDLAMETFIFDNTYLDLPPYSEHMIPVYFTKAEHIGYHQCYYDFEFCRPDTETIILTKTVILLAEVLPHPIKIYPQLLDMSTSPITHGFCEDRIYIHNTHKVHYVTAKIKLTTKMKKLFQITPLDLYIPPKSKYYFDIRLCSREFKTANNFEDKDFVHFTIKIILCGNDSIFYNVPIIFYEIILPCAHDFKNAYNKKYYREVSYTSHE